ncbi:hypothetical protein HPP92_026702 [Vanilla planifolia]|uniref:Radical SAM core domain-containing protein n=1 Tax=Vanilla planifolia TaxID=51239 RepID=A0A835U764_VANPL|nr:hypothetical protein HPP92_026926 [Vanilla planifolia]KAG0450535.1 hypothetical protein HPP92_026702 [Vanilla planifolia]
MAVLQTGCSVPLARALRTRCSMAAVNSSPALSSQSLGVPRLSNSDSRFLLGMSETELRKLALDLGQQSYRGKQLHDLIYKTRAKEIQEFSHLPQAFREELRKAGWMVGRSSTHHVVTASDGTIKILIRLHDNRLIETVGIPVDDDKGFYRLTACVSSQVGCPLRCSFCATGKGGYSRNLRVHEIVEQVMAIEELFKHRVTNVVFMGMGEPMLNLKSVLQAHRCLNKVMPPWNPSNFCGTLDCESCLIDLGYTDWPKNDDNIHCWRSKHNQDVGFTQASVYLGSKPSCS